MTIALHPDIEPLAAVLGTWTGSGRGEYSTIEAFDYDETLHFSHVGKPFLTYNQSTSTLSTGACSIVSVASGAWHTPVGPKSSSPTRRELQR